MNQTSSDMEYFITTFGSQNPEAEKNFREAVDEMVKTGIMIRPDPTNPDVVELDLILITHIIDLIVFAKTLYNNRLLKTEDSPQVASTIMGASIAKLYGSPDRLLTIRRAYVLSRMGFVERIDNKMLVKVEGS